MIEELDLQLDLGLEEDYDYDDEEEFHITRDEDENYALCGASLHGGETFLDEEVPDEIICDDCLKIDRRNKQRWSYKILNKIFKWE